MVVQDYMKAGVNGVAWAAFVHVRVQVRRKSDFRVARIVSPPSVLSSESSQSLLQHAQPVQWSQQNTRHVDPSIAKVLKPSRPRIPHFAELDNCAQAKLSWPTPSEGLSDGMARTLNDSHTQLYRVSHSQL